MSMLCFLIVDNTVNKDKLIKICLVHDLAESIVGDITPYDGVTKEEKRKLEQDALFKIVSDIGNEEIGSELWQLWLEYEESTSNEAEIAKQLDKLEMIIQANEYEISHPEKRLQRFFDSTKDFFVHPEVKYFFIG
jgi:putative hydrolase of HD superfamily